ncbi:homeodomain-interacting protein kinase 2-like isoform X2 [Sparus aurata]|uniref:homeodomain-interacting protein kinase 2-like isoform X2 n=1 Tax=Sparus aurata TaxID=8175 RepID=UPI0011C10B94|nr:homeodomain-interacting protein kinase 2-like isoform X2 [Sparus aurata]
MNPTELPTCCLSELPSEYKFLKVLGEGSFGKVVRCLNKETNETVAIKFPKYLDEDTMNEIPMLRKITCYNLDEYNIVKYIDCFQTRVGKALVFEPLDISVYDYIKMRSFAPMLLSDIRTIIKQMATAFDALKGLQVIHTDVKLDNIMMVNHLQQPFEVKLIDFGLAIYRSEARTGTILQPEAFRSPEIILGCPFSEAIDMWGLGCAMFRMICGCDPFSGETEYEIMLSIVELLGQPADRLLDKGERTRTFFKDTDYDVWRIKTPCQRRANKDHKFQSLDDLKVMRLEEKNNSEAVEREQCIELLKAMLEIDPDERITPSEVLTHPFITKDYPNVQIDMVKASTSLGFECEPPAAPLKDEDSINIQPDDCTPSPEILPSGVILVRPVTAENTLLLEDLESTVSEPPAPPLKEGDSISIQQDDCTLCSEIIPSGVILVRPVTAENTLLLEDLESTASFQSGLNKTSESSVSDPGSNLEISEDSTTCDTGTRKKGKRKNSFRRIVSWLKKTFSRVSPID